MRPMPLSRRFYKASCGESKLISNSKRKTDTDFKHDELMRFAFRKILPVLLVGLNFPEILTPPRKSTCGFNRSMQHNRSCVSGESVAAKQRHLIFQYSRGGSPAPAIPGTRKY
jgi:hypothetical protein